MKKLLVIIGMLTLAAVVSVSARADDKIGIVLMHGKQGMPLGKSPPGGNRPPAGGELIAALKDAGYLVTTPEMCWSRQRGLDKAFSACLTEIDDAIADLKAHGATAFVVGGLSQGGLAAIAYGASHADILGVIAYAPADDPVGKSRLPAIAATISKAQRMVADGKGGERASFDDVNTGPQGSFTMTLNTTADIYLSFYAADAATGMAGNMAKLKVPVLWIYSESDPSQRGATSYFEKAPANPLNRQVKVFANHIETVNAGRAATLAWIRELIAQP
jgi:pimeloyl-ACP methyl ester carboxylesterase